MKFRNEQFTDILKTIFSKYQTVTPRRHLNNILESKQGIKRSIYLRLRSATPDADKYPLFYQAVAYSIDLYDSDTVTTFEHRKDLRTKSKEMGYDDCDLMRSETIKKILRLGVS